jgi:UDP-glucose 4-epimerase
MRILVTGGAGFIGANLVDHHLRRGDDVFAVDDLSTGRAENVDAFRAHANYHFERADIVDWPGFAEAVRWADRIYHMAAVVGVFRVLKEPIAVTRVNVIGFERLLEAMVGAPRAPQLVAASTSSVYGAAPTDQMHETANLVLDPRSPLQGYALSKLMNEIQAAAYAETHGLKVVMARLFNTVGRRQSGVYGFVVPRFVQQALAGKPLTVFGDGRQTRSFCDVRDTVAILDALAATPAALGQAVNVGRDSEITIGALADLVRARTGSASALEYVPYSVAYGKSYDQIPQRRPTLGRLAALTGYRHRYTLEDSIDDLVAYYGELRAAGGGGATG